MPFPIAAILIAASFPLGFWIATQLWKGTRQGLATRHGFDPEDVADMQLVLESTASLYRGYNDPGATRASLTRLRSLARRRVPLVKARTEVCPALDRSTFLEFADGTLLRLERAEAALDASGAEVTDRPESLLPSVDMVHLAAASVAAGVHLVLDTATKGSIRIVASGAAVVA